MVSQERCVRCGSVIADDVMPRIWKETIVCEGCYGKLAGAVSGGARRRWPAIWMGVLGGYVLASGVGTIGLIVLAVVSGHASAASGYTLLAAVSGAGVVAGYFVTVAIRKARGVQGPEDEWVQFLKCKTFFAAAAVVILGSLVPAVGVKLGFDAIGGASGAGGSGSILSRVMGSNVADEDYCTIALAPKLRAELGADESDVIRRVTMRDVKYRAMEVGYRTAISITMSSKPGPEKFHSAAVYVGVDAKDDEERSRKMLEEQGRKVREMLTPAQDRQFRSLVAAGKIAHVSVKTEVEAGNGRLLGKTLTYTHYNDREVTLRAYRSEGKSQTRWVAETVEEGPMEAIKSVDEALAVLECADPNLHQWAAQWLQTPTAAVPEADCARVREVLQRHAWKETEQNAKGDVLAALQMYSSPNVAHGVAAVHVPKPVVMSVGPSTRGGGR